MTPDKIAEILAGLEAQRAPLAARIAVMRAERAGLVFDAAGSGPPPDLADLDARLAAAERDLDANDAAIAEGERRLLAARNAEAAARRETSAERVRRLAKERARIAGRIDERIADIADLAADFAKVDAELLEIAKPPSDVRIEWAHALRAGLNRCGFERLGAALWPGPAMPWEQRGRPFAASAERQALDLIDYVGERVKPLRARASRPTAPAEPPPHAA